MTTATVQKCRIAAKTLKDAVAQAASAVPRRTAVPVLMNLLLQSTEGQAFLAVTGTDLEIAVRATVPTGVLLGDAAEDFAICVNGAKFAAFVSSLPDHQPVEMEVTDTALIVVCARSRGRFPVTDPEEFPPFLGGKDTTPLLTAMGQRVGKALDAVLPFVATNDKGRPALMGAYLSAKIQPGELTTIGADGYIISVYRSLDYGVPEGKRAEFKFPTELILNGRSAAKLAEVASAAGEARVALALVGEEPNNPTGLAMNAELGAMTVDVYGRTMEGPYPAAAIASVMPSHGESEEMPSVTVTAPLLTAAVRRVSTFGSDSVYGAPINLSVVGAGYERQGVLTVRASGSEEGEGIDTLDCEAMTGYGDPIPADAPLHVKVGARYIVDAIRAIKDVTGAETVYLGFRGAKAFTLNDGTHDFKIAVAPLAVYAGDVPTVEPTPEPATTADLDDFAPVDDGVADLSEA